MKKTLLIPMLAMAVMSSLSVPALAQGAGPGLGRGPCAQASAPADCVRGAGPGPRASDAQRGPGRHLRHGGGRHGQRFTPGWSLMSDAERTEHRDKMRSMKTQEECRAYLGKHREAMAERAKAKGIAVHTPRRDACARLP